MAKRAADIKELLESSIQVARKNVERRPRHLMDIEMWFKVEMGNAL